MATGMCSWTTNPAGWPPLTRPTADTGGNHFPLESALPVKFSKEAEPGGWSTWWPANLGQRWYTGRSHNARLQTFLQRCREKGIKLNKKLKLLCKEIPYMGHLVTADGLKPDPEKMEAVCNMPKPNDVKAVRQFCGFVNYLQSSCPDWQTYWSRYSSWHGRKYHGNGNMSMMQHSRRSKSL